MYEQRGWSAILRSITAPVVLFGLVTGGTTATIVGFSDLAPLDKRLVVVGAGVLLLVILVMVFLLTWFRPQNLIYSETGYLAESAMGRPDNPVAKDVLAARSGLPRIREQPPQDNSGGLNK